MDSGGHISRRKEGGERFALGDVRGFILKRTDLNMQGQNSRDSSSHHVKLIKYKVLIELLVHRSLPVGQALTSYYSSTIAVMQ